MSKLHFCKEVSNVIQLHKRFGIKRAVLPSILQLFVSMLWAPAEMLVDMSKTKNTPK